MFLQDSFTGADNTLLTAHTGETGATWATSAQALFSGFSANGARIHGNMLYEGTFPTSGPAFHYPSANPSNPTFAYELDVYLDAGAASSYGTAITPGTTTSGMFDSVFMHVDSVLCYDSVTNSYYKFWLRFTRFFNGVSFEVKVQLSYQVRDNGVDVVNTTLAQASFSAGAHTFRFEIGDLSGWAVMMDGTTLASGATYFPPVASQNLCMSLATNSTFGYIMLDEVRGYDLAEPVTYPVTGFNAVAFGQPAPGLEVSSIDAVAFGQPTVAIPAARVRSGIRAVVFGKPVGPNTAPRRVAGKSVVRFGVPTALHIKP